MAASISAIGMGQANIERVEFNGMAAGKYAVNSIISLNVHFHDSFVTHMKKNGPNSILKNNAILSVNNNQFEHTGGDAGVEHTFWSLTGFSFLSNFYDNYLEGTWGCFVRQGDPAAALIGLEVRNTFARQNPSGVPDVPNGKPNPIVVDLRNTTKYAVVDGLVYHSAVSAVAAGNPIVDDPYHAVVGEGVTRFNNQSTGAQANRILSQLDQGISHTGVRVGTHNPIESGRRSGRGIFPVNADQGVGNPTNFTIFLPTDVGANKGAWTTATVYDPGDEVTNGSNVYRYQGVVAGTSGASAPTGTSLTADVGDGVLLWRYQRADGDLNKVQPGAYLLGVTIRSANKSHAASGYYIVTFDDQATNDYTDVMQIGTTRIKGVNPTSLAVTTTPRGVLTVTANQGTAEPHECSFS